MNPESANELLAAAKKLAHMVVVGHENELQGAWPANGQQHKCKSCYKAAKVLQQEIADFERAEAEKRFERGRESYYDWRSNT